MTGSLFHPPHIAAALAAVDDLGPDDLLGALSARPGSTSHVPNEAVVRIIRRARVEADRKMEGIALKALMDRVWAWATRTYLSLTPSDAEHMAVVLGERVFEKVARESAVDYWEITFERNVKRLAADIYRQSFEAKFRKKHVEFDVAEHGDDDGGTEQRAMVLKAFVTAKAERVLDQEELKYFPALFISGVPLSSKRASVDLVRELGRPEGTLREIKTRIVTKLKAAMGSKFDE